MAVRPARYRFSTVSSPRYFICLGDGTPAIAWDLSETDEPVRFDCVYFGRALRAMEERLRTRDLTVYLTWDLRELPSYGDDVVAVVLGDEESRRPVYADSVRAVFKCSGERPWIGSALLRRRTYLSLLIFLQGARRWLRHLPDDLRVLRRRLQGRRPRPVEHLPLGYYNQLDLPLTDFDARRTAVFFAGSLERMQRSRLSPRRWLRMPKSVARQEMLDALGEYRRRRPEVPLNLRLTPSLRRPPGRTPRAIP